MYLYFNPLDKECKSVKGAVEQGREIELSIYTDMFDSASLYIEKDDKSIIAPASFFQVYESAGHTLPRAMQNVSNTVYNEDKGDRWDITRFWNEAIFTDIAECWRFACEVRQIEEEMMTELERATKQAQKQQRLEKAKKERLKGNPPEDIVVEFE